MHWMPDKWIRFGFNSLQFSAISMYCAFNNGHSHIYTFSHNIYISYKILER